MNSLEPRNLPSLKKNIYKYYIAMFFRNLWITMPIHILYYQARGLSFFQMGILEAVISAVIFFTDIPSGAFADIFGRKITSSLGLFLWGMSLILTALTTTFHWYIFAAILLGFGDSFISGALQALFYDSLKELNLENKILKYTGNRDLIDSFAIILAALLGAILFEIAIELPFLAHGFTLIVAAFIVLSMKEPHIPYQAKSIHNQISLIKSSLKFTFTNSKIRFISIFWMLIVMVPMLFVDMMEQPYLTQLNIPIVWFGIIFAVTRGVIGFFAPLRYKIEKKIGERTSFYGLVIVYILFFGLMIIISNWIAIIILFLFFFSRDYSWAILDKYANDHISSERRATVLSIINFGINTIYMIGVIIMGALMDHFTIFGLNSVLSTLFLLAILCGTIILPFLIWNYKKFDRVDKKVENE